MKEIIHLGFTAVSMLFVLAMTALFTGRSCTQIVESEKTERCKHGCCEKVVEK